MSMPVETEDAGFMDATRLFHDLPFIGMAITSPSTKRWLQVNQTLCDLLGYPRDVLMEMSWAELTHPDDIARDVAEFDRVMRGETDGYKMDKRFVRSTGELVHAAIDVKAVRGQDGAVQCFVATIADLTARVAAESAARASAALLVKLGQQVPGVIYQFLMRPDGSSCFPYASEAIREIYEVDPEEVREDAAVVFSRLHPDDVARVSETIAESARDLTPWQCEYRVVLPRQGQRWLRGDARPERQPDGGTLWHGCITDITASQRLQEQVLHAQKLESVGRLAGGVAHDFNNLLTVMKGCLDLVLDEVGTNPAVRDDLLQIRRAANSAAELTQQLLAFSRKQVISPRVLDLAEVVQHLQGMLERLLGEDIVLEVRTHASGHVKFDPSQAEQILINLAINARDAMPAGGRLTLETSVVTIDERDARAHPGMAPGDYVLLVVSDTGTGMSPETLAHAFEPFFTTKEVGAGTGLGLAMIHGAVSQNGGRVAVTSEPGRGTTFRIYLPRVHEPVVAPPAVARGTLPRGSEAILVVEDDASVRALMAKLLTRQGYRVTACASGAEAIAWVRSHDAPLDLLLTDVIMPGMNGKVLASTITSLRPGIALLFASGYTANVIEHHGVLSPGVEFIAKPFAASDLATRVRQLLDARAAAR